MFIIVYAIFQGLFAPAMPQLYASARESINVSSSRNNAKFANTVLRSMFSFGFLFGPLIGAYLIQFMGYAGLLVAPSLFYYSHLFYKSSSIKI